MLRLKTRWLPYCCIVIFILAKIPHLTLAFYWDESWVYAPSVYTMYAHGPSLLPDAIPLDYSRGHPLLFQAGAALWMKLFGTSHAAMHCYALFIAIALAIAVYEIMRRLFGLYTALISLLLLLLNHFFFIDSSMVLNDIMLGAAMLLSLYCYVRAQHLLTALLLTITLYTKESGIVIIPILLADITISAIRKEHNRRQITYKAISLAVPLLLSFLFYIAQKTTFGWFMNPGHTGMINTSIDNTFCNLQRTFNLLIYSDSNFFFWGLCAALCVAAAIVLRKPRYLWLLPLIVMTYLCACIFSHRDAVFCVFVLLLIAICSLLLFRTRLPFGNVQARFLKLVPALGFAYTYFCCINFYEGRYLFPTVLAFNVVLLGVLCGYLTGKMSTRIQLCSVAALAAGGLLTFTLYSEELIVPDRVLAQQALVDYFEANNFYSQNIYCPRFLQHRHLFDPLTGFLRKKRPFTNISDNLEPSTTLVVLDNIEANPADSVLIKNDFSLLHEIRIKNEWVGVYKRR